MMFAIENTELAQDVVDTLVESLTISQTPLPLKVARMYLVSDILYNSGSAQVKNATMYRTLIQPKLPEVRRHFWCLVSLCVATSNVTDRHF